VIGNPHIKMTTSVIDYIFREMAVTYLGREDLAHVAPEEIMNRTLRPADAPDPNDIQPVVHVAPAEPVVNREAPALR
jgi:hypothetical protein